MKKTKITNRFAKGLYLFLATALLAALAMGTAAADGRKMYWTDNYPDAIQRANMDGT